MQGLRSQKKRSLHGVNEHFFDERNAAGGHYGQTLLKNNPVTVDNNFLFFEQNGHNLVF